MDSRSGPLTKAELRVALDKLVRLAYSNGVDVGDGGYVLRHPDTDIPDWEIQIIQTVKRADQND